MGAGAVGKSCLTLRFVQDRVTTEYVPTIEDSYSKLTNVDGHDARLDILDTAGQDDFAAMRETYMRQGDGFILVFAVNDAQTFDEIDTLQKDIKITKGSDDTPIVICGNKSDLPLDSWAVTRECIKEYCDTVKITYLETSAISGKNVTQTFQTITRLLRAKNPDYQVIVESLKAEPDIVTRASGGCGCEIQ